MLCYVTQIFKLVGWYLWTGEFAIFICLSLVSKLNYLFVCWYDSEGWYNCEGCSIYLFW